MIVQHKHFSMEEYGRFFEEDFNEWKTGLKQTDDVLLIGIEF